MQTYGIVSLLLVLIIGLGAYKVWGFLVKTISKPFSNPPVDKIRRWAFIIVAMSVCAMLSPFLLPFNSGLRIAVWGLYLLYGGLGVSQIYDWVTGLTRRSSNPPAGK